MRPGRLVVVFGASALAVPSCARTEESVEVPGAQDASTWDAGTEAGGTPGKDAAVDVAVADVVGCIPPCTAGQICAGSQCCEPERACGNACCASGDVCSFQTCVKPGSDCVNDVDCNDGYCEYQL